MPSPTRRALTVKDIARLVARTFGLQVGVATATDLDSGFAAVWRLELTDGQRVVLKVSPPPEARLLRYEQGMIGAEFRYLRLLHREAPTVAVPLAVGHGRDHDAEWLFASLLPGRSLAKVGSSLDDRPVRQELGATVARINAIPGESWGYDGARSSGATWPEAFTAIVEALLADAEDFNVRLPIEPATVRALLTDHYDALANVTKPSLVHFDLWDGNVIVDESGFTGLVDGERHLFGDPLMDLVSPALYRRMEDEPDHPFLKGYGPLRIDDSARRRLALYRVHLYLLMVVEMPSRGMTADTDRRDRLTDLLLDEIANLG